MATAPPMTIDSATVVDVAGLSALVDHLVAENDEVWGPRLVDGVIAPGVLGSVDDLPLGWADEQSGGRYRVRRRDDGARFGYAVGPRSYRELLHPPRHQVWSMTRSEDGELTITMTEPAPIRRALFGVRPCELAAITKQDRILRDGPHPDPVYSANRESLFIVAVDCGSPAASCFCPSVGTGPWADAGFDLAVTELVGDDPSGGDSRYVVRVGSDSGRAVLDAVTRRTTVGSRPAGTDERAQVNAVISSATEAMTRRLDTDAIRELIYGRLESDQWVDIADRCLACGNCTLVCPTCFCTNMEDVTDLTGAESIRWRVWDTCFSTEFSHLGPGPVRDSTAARYRQWFTHKLAGWIDQFGESGCVGCGRCITWCPVGIDITEELAVLRTAEGTVEGTGQR